MSTQSLDILKKFREELHHLLPLRRDALLDLLDALTSNNKASSVVKLSLNALFRRKYSSITDAIKHFPKLVEEILEPEQTRAQLEQKSLYRLIAEQCSQPSDARPYYLFAADCSACPRPHAKKLTDKTSVYAPNNVPGNKPIAIGHQYANLVYLPEKTPNMPPWVLPLLTQRVDSESVGHVVDIGLMEKLLNDEILDFKNKLCVLVADTPHSSATCRSRVVSHENLVMVARIRGNRNVYAQPGADDGKKWFGEKMNLAKSETHHEPDDSMQFEITTPRGKVRTIELKIWRNMLVRGQKEFRSDKHPFSLVKVTVLNQDGKAVYNKPMWLMAQGERCAELSLKQIFESYRQRFDIEHYFRFGKQNLLLDKFQTTDTEHEENWWQLALLAYVQLYLAKDASQNCPYDWEKHWAKNQEAITSPSHVMRDFQRLLTEIGTPGAKPTTRGIPAGRKKGETQIPRPDQSVIYKNNSKKHQTKAKKKAKKQSTGFENQQALLKPDNLDELLTFVKILLPKLDCTLDKFLEKARLVCTT